MSGGAGGRQHYPWWVRLVTIGATSRRALLFWGGLYAVMAVVSVVIALLFEEDLTWGVGFAVPFAGLALLHWLSAAWIDRHGSWS